MLLLILEQINQSNDKKLYKLKIHSYVTAKINPLRDHNSHLFSAFVLFTPKTKVNKFVLTFLRVRENTFIMCS